MEEFNERLYPLNTMGLSLCKKTSKITIAIGGRLKMVGDNEYWIVTLKYLFVCFLLDIVSVYTNKYRVGRKGRRAGEGKETRGRKLPQVNQTDNGPRQRMNDRFKKY